MEKLDHNLKRIGESLNSLLISEVVATLREGTGPLQVILRNGKTLTFTDQNEINLIQSILFPDVPDVPPESGNWKDGG